MHAGEGVLLLNGAANHDVTLFPDPFTFDPTGTAWASTWRSGTDGTRDRAEPRATRHHTRADGLVDQAPTMRLECEPASLDYASATAVTSLHSLPVSW